MFGPLEGLKVIRIWIVEWLERRFREFKAMCWPCSEGVRVESLPAPVCVRKKTWQAVAEDMAEALRPP